MHGNSPDGYSWPTIRTSRQISSLCPDHPPPPEVAGSTDGGYEPRWRADGREIYYLSEDRKLMAVAVGAGPTFAVPKMLFQTRVPEGVTSRRTHYVPSRDGKRFLINTQTGDLPPNPITVVINWQTELRK